MYHIAQLRKFHPFNSINSSLENTHPPEVATRLIAFLLLSRALQTSLTGDSVPCRIYIIDHRISEGLFKLGSHFAMFRKQDWRPKFAVSLMIIASPGAPESYSSHGSSSHPAPVAQQRKINWTKGTSETSQQRF